MMKLTIETPRVVAEVEVSAASERDYRRFYDSSRSVEDRKTAAGLYLKRMSSEAHTIASRVMGMKDLWVGEVKVVTEVEEVCSHCGLKWEEVAENEWEGDTFFPKGLPCCCNVAVQEFLIERFGSTDTEAIAKDLNESRPADQASEQGGEWLRKMAEAEERCPSISVGGLAADTGMLTDDGLRKAVKRLVETYGMVNVPGDSLPEPFFEAMEHIRRLVAPEGENDGPRPEDA